jgi:acetylornithine deacetylase/succinyl-diaminopimelate desuccinylase-like protein
MDWNKETDEVVDRLRRMIRFDTTNPPGDEIELALALAAEVKEQGLDAEVVESGERRGNLAVRLRGDGSERPVLLMSHLDVVPAEPDQWTHPPFSGSLADGYVWGRGAIDSKLTGAVQLQALLMAHRLKLPLKRDLVLIAAADEERGGECGMEWLAKNRPSLFDAEYGINEGGGFAVMIDGSPVYGCQVGEKGSASVDLVAKGMPGHSSVPHQENSIVRLGPVLARLGERKLPHQPPASVQAFFEHSARAQSDEGVAELLRAVLDPSSCDAALSELPVSERDRLMFDAMVRNTCAPTLLESGIKRNVIPSEARAGLSGRSLPGATEAEFVEEVREVVGHSVELEMTLPFTSGIEFDHESPLFGALTAAMQRFEPDAAVVPFMQTGGTDARFLTDFDLHIYGFIPMLHEPGPGFFELCHGHDERVSVSNVKLSVQVLFEAVRILNGIAG